MCYLREQIHIKRKIFYNLVVEYACYYDMIGISNNSGWSNVRGVKIVS